MKFCEKISKKSNISEFRFYMFTKQKKVSLPDGELNPGLPRDRRGYWPLYYRGHVNKQKLNYLYLKFKNLLFSHIKQQKQ